MAAIISICQDTSTIQYMYINLAVKEGLELY